jgi:hypothetical protein
MGAYSSAVQQLQGMGGPGRDTISQVTANYNSVVAQMDRINQARGYRTTTIAGLPVPQFATGSAGIIPGQGAFAAVLHAGEAVLNPQAAAKLGSSKIKALNQGDDSSQGDLHIHGNLQIVCPPGIKNPKEFARELNANHVAVIKLLRREHAEHWI